jgi:hypothetical protein
LGTIGVTLAGLLLRYRELLQIQDVFLHKNAPQPWEAEELSALQADGAVLCAEAPSAGWVTTQQAMGATDYLFDCNAQGQATKRKPRYEGLSRLRGACAQGSEIGFGVPFMLGVNNEVISGQRFVQVVSCNTHGTAAILQALAGQDLAALDHADVVVVRRSEDLGRHARLVTSSVVARHLCEVAGTHHGADVQSLFATVGARPQLTTSDVTTPSQLMHCARFSVRLREPLPQDLDVLWRARPLLATTHRFDSNHVFELGRRYGFHGRLYEHAIVVSNNLLRPDPYTVRGWCFVPQEGNTLLSTLAAFVLQTDHLSLAAVMSQLRADLTRPYW